MRRHTEILREVVRVISPNPKRENRPKSAAEAEERFESFLADLKAKTPRYGLAAPTAQFVDHLDVLRERYGSHLFVCFDDALVPPTTNALESFFSSVKRHERQMLGTKSTANSLVQNLGVDYLLLLSDPGQVRNDLATTALNVSDFEQAREELRAREAPARRRRSAVRSFSKRVEALRRATRARAP